MGRLASDKRQGVEPGGVTIQVVMINGSTHRNGCPYTALVEVAGQLEQ
jgi:hypothetical protein